jgi:ubiquinone/menaquinone biosynthesis C-methylase UbiE
MTSTNPLSLPYWHRRYVQQAQWTRALRHHLLTQLGLVHADSILDVGSGTGALLGELGEDGKRTVTGIDIDRASLAFARQGEAPPPGANAQLVCADGHALPFQDASFDLVVCHFVLLWVDDPLLVLQEMRRVVHLGGAALALAEPDYGGRIDYPPASQELGRMQAEALQRQGADLTIGRKLRGLFRQAGFEMVQVGVLGGEWSQDFQADEIEGEQAVLRSDLQGLPGFDSAEFEALLAQDRLAWQRGERLLYVPTFYAVGKVEE